MSRRRFAIPAVGLVTSASLCAAAFFVTYVIRSSESLGECQMNGIVAWAVIAGTAAYGFVRALGSMIRSARGDAKFRPQFEYRQGPWELPEGVLTDVVPTDSSAAPSSKATEV